MSPKILIKQDFHNHKSLKNDKFHQYFKSRCHFDMRNVNDHLIKFNDTRWLNKNKSDVKKLCLKNPHRSQ